MQNTSPLQELTERKLELKLCGYSNVNAKMTDAQELHSHNYWQMNLCRSGFATLGLGKYNIELKTGDIVIFPPGIKHVFFYDKVQPLGSFSFKFDLKINNLEKEFPCIIEKEEATRKLRLDIINAVYGFFFAFFPDALTQTQLQFLVSKDWDGVQILEDLLWGIVRNAFLSTSCSETDTPIMRKITEYVLKRNGRPVSVEEIAGFTGYSAGHLRSILLAETGMTTKEVIDRIRIKTAKHFLHYSDLNVGELSEYMGFSDMIYFYRFFKKYTNETPSEYMRKTRKMRSV